MSQHRKLRYNTCMEYSNSFHTRIFFIIDYRKTSRLLKELRIKNGYSIKDLQEVFGFETPTAIYAWENEKHKSIPRLEHLTLLSKLYNCHVEELYITKQVEDIEICEPVIIYRIGSLNSTAS